MSGARDDRTGYQALLDYIRPGDTIVVTALDLGRSLTSIVNTSATWASAESTSAPCASRSTPSTSVGRMLARAVRQPGRVRAGTDRRAGPRRPAGGRDPWQAARPTAKAPGGQGGPGPAHARRRRVRAHHRPGPGRVPRHAVPGTGESVGVLTAETCRPGSQTSRHSSGHDNRHTLTSASGHGPTAPVGSRALNRPVTVPTNPRPVVSDRRHFATIGVTVPTKPAKSICILGDEKHRQDERRSTSNNSRHARWSRWVPDQRQPLGHRIRNHPERRHTTTQNKPDKLDNPDV